MPRVQDLPGFNQRISICGSAPPMYSGDSGEFSVARGRKPGAYRFWHTAMTVGTRDLQRGIAPVTGQAQAAATTFRDGSTDEVV
jgi:hypothetical protein